MWLFIHSLQFCTVKKKKSDLNECWNLFYHYAIRLPFLRSKLSVLCCSYVEILSTRICPCLISSHAFVYSGLFILPMSSMVLSRYSSFLPHSTIMQTEDWWIGYFKLPLGVLRSMNSCLSQYVNPAMSEWLSRVYSTSYPKGAGDDFYPWNWITTAHTVRVFVLVEFRSRSTCGSSLRGDDLR